MSFVLFIWISQGFTAWCCSGRWQSNLAQLPWCNSQKEAARKERNDVEKAEARLRNKGVTRAFSCFWGVQHGHDTDFWLPGNPAERHSKVCLTQGNSFWCKENSSVLVEDSPQMKVGIAVTSDCPVVVMAEPAAQLVTELLLRQKEDSKGTIFVILPTASHNFPLGCASSGNSPSFCCYNDCATSQEKLKTCKQDFWES